MNPASPPRILLAEDDPVSLAFLGSALQELGCEVEAVVDGAAAESSASQRPFDLLVLDHRMPRLDGDRVLQIARSDPRGPNRNAPAIATTADPDGQLHDRLIKAGFRRVLVKPSSKSRLRDALRELGLTGEGSDAVLDDAAGLAASGSAEILGALRGLFATELDALAREFESLRHDPARMGERLHRLQAACGFCGALALQKSAEAFSNALRVGESTRIVESAHAFRRALESTRAALEK